MSRPRNPVPTYRRRRGLAVVTVYDADGNRFERRLGKYNSKESGTEYERVLAQLRAGRPAVTDDAITVAEVPARYRRHAEAYCANGRVYDNVRRAIRAVRLLYSHLPADEFSPVKLRAVRDEMVKDGRLSRVVVNQRIGIVKRAFDARRPADGYAGRAAV